MKNKQYEWIIVGGGITGIVLSEILTREGHSVLLLEKEDKLASKTTRDFHEWMHMGSLYTLIPDNLLTLKYILGAVDDLLEYYSSFENMNLTPSTEGLKIERQGWFEKNYINFKFRIQGRKWTFPWLFVVARSLYLIDALSKHDWLRRRAGVIDDFKLLRSIKQISKSVLKLLLSKEKFYKTKTVDMTMNSRELLNDLVNNAKNNGLEIKINSTVVDIESNNNLHCVKTKSEQYYGNNVILSCAENIKEFTKVDIQTTYAPMAVVDNLPHGAESFVELDYFTKNCINLLTKYDKSGLIGGITVKTKEEIESYLSYIKNEHKKLFPSLEVLGDYVGLKNEITFQDQDRNYLYHIVKEKDRTIWSVIPGKFSLAFSLAPEFYRQVYGKNPQKSIEIQHEDKEQLDIIANTVWKDLLDKKEENGNH
jgi:hypothetical protein